MSAHNDVADIIDSLRTIAGRRRPNDPLLQSFLGVYYRDVPSEDADSKRLNAAYAAAVAHLQLGRTRRAGETLVEVLSPDLERDGWETERTILMFVTDDVPFLVDSVRMVLDCYELGIHLLIHPMLSVGRNDRHELVDVDAPDGRVEAWTLIELDRCPPDQRATLEAEVRTAIDDVQSVVRDFSPMQERLCEVAGDDQLLRWLADENFVFLGSAIYERSAEGLRLQPDSLLGQYRTHRLDAERIDPPAKDGDESVVIARTDAVATVHRSARMTSIAVRSPATRQEVRFVGLLGSAVYRQSVFAIPVIGARAYEVVARVGAAVESHTGRAVRNVIETLPRDVVFEVGVDELVDLVGEISGLQERRIVRVFDISEPVGPWTTVLAYVPQSRFTAALPDLVAALVSEYYGGGVRDLETLVGASSLARISMTVRSGLLADTTRLVASIDRASRTWGERARDALVDLLGEVEGHRVWSVVRATVPADYEARVHPEAAVGDLVIVESMLSGSDEITTSFGRSIDAVDGQWRFRVFLRDRPTTIAELVPALEHLGLCPLDEHPSVFVGNSTTVYLDDIGVRLSDHTITDAQHSEVQRAFVDLMTGGIEPDELNRLVLSAGLDRRQIAVLRLYNRYLRQASIPFSPRYVERAIVRHPEIARALVELFDTKFDPRRTELAEPHERSAAVERCRDDLHELLDAVPSLDDDRICRAFLTLIDATDRTNAFRHRSEVAVKLRPHDVGFLPEPRPEFEIFVCSPFVEGVHLRGGRIARGGLRWSDRPEDFRTEVLGLVKAQMVKNAVIVPSGAKGGFVIKSSTVDPADRDAVRAQGIDRYGRFVRAMLDVTDNVVADRVVHPRDVVIYDGDDPYLVVAADKGTATFSDIANEIAAEYDFWLGDAFASGGSRGYDHKAMASPLAGPGRAFAVMLASSARTSTPTSSPWSVSVTCRATCSATGCCCRGTCCSSPRSITAMSSSIPLPIRTRRTPNVNACSNCHARAGPTTTVVSSLPAAVCTHVSSRRSPSPPRYATCWASIRR